MENHVIKEIWLRSGLNYQVGKDCTKIRKDQVGYLVTISSDESVGNRRQARIPEHAVDAVIEEWRI